MTALGGASSATDDRLHPAWAVVLPSGEKMLVRDMPFDVLSAIAVANGVAELADLVDHPLARRSIGAKVYREACRHRNVRPEPYDTARDLQARFEVVPTERPSDAFWDIVDALARERDDGTGDVGDADEFLAEVRRRLDSMQWVVELPDGTTRKLWDLEWALLEIVADRHGSSVDAVLDRPLAGDGRLVADLWRSITENQRQDATTEGDTFAEVWARFRLVPDDKPPLPDEGPVVDADPESDGPATD